MIPGIYVLRPGEVETTRRFDMMSHAREAMWPHDVAFVVGPAGKEIGRWIKNEPGYLEPVKKAGAPRGPRTRLRFGPRRRGYVPPAGGRGADGRPYTGPKKPAQSDLAGAVVGENSPSPQAQARPPVASCTSRREDDNSSGITSPVP